MAEINVAALLAPPDILNCKRVLCVQPHPDDNEIGMGGVIYVLARSGCELHYLTVTNGDQGNLNPNAAPEETAAVRHLGASRFHFLPHGDGTLNDVLALSREIAEVIRSVQPEAIFCPDPWLPYEVHWDHIITGRAAANAFHLCGHMKCLRAIGYYFTASPNTVVDITDAFERKLIVHIFTREYGRRSYITSPGGASPGHRVRRGLFQPLSILEFDGFSTRGELHHIEGPIIAQPLSEIPFDIVKSTIALFLSELLYRLIKEGEADPGLYDFVEGSITTLDGLDSSVAANFHLWFLVQLTHYLGYSPQDNYAEGHALDYRAGLYISSDELPHTLLMAPREAKLFYELTHATPAQLPDFALAREQRTTLLTALIDLYGFHTEAIYSVNSLRILSEIF